jgi:hypothetical protein
MQHLGQAGDGASFIRWAEGLRAAPGALAQLAEQYQRLSEQATSVHPMNGPLRESLHRASRRLRIVANLAGGWYRMARTLNPDDFAAYETPRDGSLAKEARADTAHADTAGAGGYRPRHGGDEVPAQRKAPAAPAEPRPAPRVGPWPRDPNTGQITGCAGRHGGAFADDPTVYRFEPRFRAGERRAFEWIAFCRFCGQRAHGAGVLAPEMRRRKELREHAEAGRPWKARSHAATGRETVLAGTEAPPSVVRAGQRREVKPRNDNPYGRTRSRRSVGGRHVGVAGRYDAVAGVDPDASMVRRRRIRWSLPRRRRRRTPR